MALMPPVSAISGTIGPSFAASARLMSRATSVEPVKATPATAGCATSAPPISPSPRTRCKHALRHAGLVQELHRLEGDERRLLGGLGDDRIAGRERRGDLAEEDREREIPRADADEHAAPAKREAVLLPGRAGQQLAIAELGAGLHRVISAEIDRLTDFGEGVIERLAGLGLQEGGEAPVPCLDEIGRALEASGAFRGRRQVPGGRRASRALDRLRRKRAVGLDDFAERGAVNGARHGTRLAVPLLAVDERGGAEPFPCRRARGGKEGLETFAMAEFDPEEFLREGP